MTSTTSKSSSYCIQKLPSSVTEQLEAGAFQSLCQHLQERSDSVSNMDLMTLSGFCRNCLAKVSCSWYPPCEKERERKKK